MKKTTSIAIFVSLAIACIIVLIINYNINKERKAQKYQQLQSEIKDIENKRDEAYSRVGKDEKKTESIDIISEELIRQKKEKMKAYEDKK